MAEPVRKMPADWERETSPDSADPFRYGYRIRYVHLPSGEVVEQQIPLTPEDLLDPEPGDVVGQSGPHFNVFFLVIALLRAYYESRKDVLIAGDMKMLWGIPGLKRPAPDIAVIPGVRDRDDPERTSFDVVQEGTRPCLVIEVVSSLDAETRRNDYEKKVRIYQQAGIPEYVILDPPNRTTQGRLLVSGHRLDADGLYQPIEPDERGFLLSETTGLLFGVDKDGKTPLILDSRTGERLLKPAEEAVARKAAEQQAAREAKKRQAAEQRAAREAKKRQAAEERARAAEAEVNRLRAELEKLSRKPLA
jgi:Uma2 family endonuclease